MNALDACRFVWNTTLGPNAFPALIDYTLTTNTNSSGSSLPTFDAKVDGIESVDPYFLLDFTNSNTVIWGVDCLQGNGTGLTLNASCSAEPTSLVTSFNSSQATNITLLGSFTNMTFSGYQVSGNAWEGYMCFAGIC